MPTDPVDKRVKRHRAKLRAAGLRPLQIWVPDTRQKGFATQARRQSRLLWDDVHDRRVLKWLAALADTKGWR